MFSAPLPNGFDLRLLELRHAPAIFKAVDENRLHLRPWLPWVDKTETEDDTAAFIRMSLEQFAKNQAVNAGIWQGNQIVGGIGTHPIDWLNQRVEIGYWLGQEFQGQGIVTNAARRMTTFLFDELALNRVEIRCAVENTKSSAIAKRLGFVHEGALRKAILLGGAYHDLELYGMVREDWSS